jgi:hypothetical protein
MSMAAHWPAWSLTAHPDWLRRYVVPDALRPLGRWVERSADPAISRLAMLWERLSNSCVGYVAARDGGSMVGQFVRPPGELLVAPGSGTCLDVAVLLATACDLAGLGSALIIIEPTGGNGAAHALVAVRLHSNWDLADGGVWTTVPAGFVDDVRRDVTALTGDVVVLDPVGITYPLTPSGIPGLASTLEDAARRGYQLLTSAEWRWQFGITVHGPQPDDLFRPTARPSVLPLRGIYRDPGEQTDSPLRLLRAEYRLTRFQDRDELTVLHDFAERTVDGTHMGMAVVTGSGGSGKTRLVLELAEQLRQDGWYTGPLAENLSGESVDWLATVTAPLLVVVDYADARVEDTKRLLTVLAGRPGPPAVVVLTGRSDDGDWLATIMDAATSGGHILRVERLDLPDSHPHPQAIYRAAVIGSRQVLNASASLAMGSEQPILERWTTLDLVLLGWLAVQGADLPDSHAALYDQVLTHERTYWDRTYREMTGAKVADRQLLGRAAAAVTLLGPTSRGQAAALIGRLPNSSPQDAARAARVLEACLQPAPGERLTVRPDPIGDYHLLKTLTSDPEMLGRLLSDDLEAESITHAAIVLTRVGFREPVHAAAHLQRILQDQPRHWSAVLEVAVAFGGVTEEALLATIEHQPELLPLNELSERIPFTAVGPTRLGLRVDEARYQSASDDLATRAELGARVSERRRLTGDRTGALAAIDEAVSLYRALAEANPAALTHALAKALNRQANLRAGMGNPSAALAAIDEAVSLYRALAEANPAAFTPNLATALSNQASRRAEMGDPTGALAAVDEAVNLHRALADANPAAFTANLALALSNQASRRAGMGDWAGALVAVDESVTLYRALAEANPAVFTANLALALSNQANRRAGIGDRAGALVAVDEAVTLYRALAEANPAAFTAYLALALSNQANRRAGMGDRAGGLAAIDESVTLYRALAESNAAAFTPNFAAALNNQANLRSGIGDRAGALAAIDEAVTFYRALAEANPAAFTRDLAQALNNQANRRSDVGDRAGALAAVDEAVTLRRELAEANPATFTRDLAQALNNQANRRSDVGDRTGARAAIDQAVTFYRALAETNPATFTPDLAAVLNNQADIRAGAGDRAGALLAVNEAVTLYWSLAEANPAAFTPNLATALTNQASRRSQVGDRAGGLAAISEAVTLRRALAEANPAAFNPNLATALGNQASRRAEMGDRAGALAAIDEAVTLNRTLAEANPAAFTANLATALNNQANLRSGVGDGAGALAASDEAVTLRRALAEADPATFTPDLAAALNNQANRRSGLGDRAGALAASDEAVTLYRALAEADPRAFNPRLAGALNNQANRRAEVGDRPGALAASDEAVTSYRALAESNPRAFTPALAMGLNNQANRRAEVGDRAGALAAIDEAVTLRRVLAAANPAAFTRSLAGSTRQWATLQPEHGARIWEDSRNAITHLHLRALLTAAAAAWTAEHHQRDNAALLLHAAASEATHEPADDWPSVPLSAVQDARAMVRQTAQNLDLETGRLPAWVTTPIPETHRQLASDAASAHIWPQLADLLRQHADLFTDATFKRTLDNLQILYPEDSTLDQLAAIHDDATQHSLDAVLDDRDRQYTRAQTVQEWIAKPTWADSFAYFHDHRDTLTNDDVAEDLLQSGEPVRVQHSAIVRLARNLPLDIVQEIVTDLTVATAHAHKAVEDANLRTLRLLAAANRQILEAPGSGSLVVAVLIAAGGQDSTDAIQQARQQMTDTQTKAGRIRLTRLISNAPIQLREPFTKLLAAYDQQ